MPDASGTPSTNFLIPKFNTAVDPPSGKGTNTIVDFVDNLLKNSFAQKPASIADFDMPMWDSATSTWVRSSVKKIPSSQISGLSAGIPTGGLVLWSVATAPTGWSLCDGTARKRSGLDPGDSQDYSALFALYNALGLSTYGVGDGSTTFNVPDLRGRVPVGVGTHSTVNALGVNDGTALANRSPKHRHTTGVGTLATGNDTPDHSHAYYGDSGAAGATAYAGLSRTTAQLLQSTAGASARHTHPVTGAPSVGPGAGTEPLDGEAYIAINYIVKL